MDGGSRNLNADETGDTNRSVGILVIKDGQVLCGVRDNTSSPGLVCGPGGHVKSGETYRDAAIRETEEEFGITPTELELIGFGPKEEETGMSPALFLCTEYASKPDTASTEMKFARFMEPDQIYALIAAGVVFKPFADSMDMLLDAVAGWKESAKESTFDAKCNKTLDNCHKNAIIKSYNTTTDDDSNSVDWITVNGAHVPLTENGNVAAGGPTSLKSESFSGAKSTPGSEASNESGRGSSSAEEVKDPKVSGKGANTSPKGFASAQKLDQHYSKHVKKDGAKLYEGMAQDDYETHAKKFLSMPCGGDIDGFATSEGKVIRFNKASGEYASGFPGGAIKTCMVAKVDKSTGKARLELAQEYFRKRKAAEGESEGGPEA